ncbi:alpha/beta hydrolase [Kovacikia minuta]|uniref:alpha/beta hydrolase n=1 Tax=Kovacikia minuta TaxID=2931930 RepID=UPI0020C78252|nr:alpha/beta hydrolase [Kovacikia minuta]
MSRRQALRHRLLGQLTWGRVLRSLLFIYLAIGLYGYFFSDRLIFRPSASSYQDNQNTIKLTTSKGVQISAVYLPNSQATYTLLYSHGNGEDLGDIRPILEQLRTIGFAVFAYDYQGYGTSQGSPSEQNAYQDIDAAYHYLTTQLKLPPDRLIVFGRSVGGGPSVDLASRQPVAGLILESTFTSVFRVITRIPLYPFDKFANINKIQAVHCPVLIIARLERSHHPLASGAGTFSASKSAKKISPNKRSRSQRCPEHCRKPLHPNNPRICSTDQISQEE